MKFFLAVPPLHCVLRGLIAGVALALWGSQSFAACSAYRGSIVFNEVQVPTSGTAYVELRVLDPAIVAATSSFSGWSLVATRKAVSGGAVSSTTANFGSVATNTAANTCGTNSAWIQVPDASIGTYLATARNTYDMNYVLYDASGNMVDVLRIAKTAPSSFYSGAGSQCAAIEGALSSTVNNKYDFLWQNGSSIKDWYRTTDGLGTWTGTVNSNNTNSICGSNDVAATAQVGLNKVASASTVNVGSSFSFTLYAQNPATGAAKTNYAVTDNLTAAGLSFVSCSATSPDTCTHSGGTVTWTISSLPVNTTRSATLTVTASSAGTVTNTITSGASTANTSVTVAAIAPVVTTSAATSVASTSATLNGSVVPGGASTSIVINYGTSTGNYTTGSCTPAGSPFSSSSSFSCNVTGLTCGTTYYFRATGTNSAGVGNGGEQSFTPACGGATFDAYETSYTSTQAIAGTARIKTHVASGSGLCVNGGACNLTIGTFNSGKTALQTSFTGPVKVDIVDASTGNGCTTATTIATVAASQTLSGTGETTVTLPAVANAYPNARIRVTYPASGTATSQNCSADNFAIRPDSFASVSAKNATWSTAGSTNTLNATSAAGTPIHKVGRPFSLNATAVNVSGTTTTNYSGTPTAVLSACAGTACLATPGTLTVGGSFASGVLASTAASYNDVGAFSLVLQDSSFAAVDAADSTVGERTISSSAVSVGRFVPDHFATVVTTAGCAGFSYSGQPITLFQVYARDAAGTTLTNYASATGLSKLLTLSDALGVAGSFASTSIASTSFTSGVSASSPKFTFTSRSTVPSDIRLSVQDADGVSSTTGTDGTSASAVQATTRIVSGRLALANAYGSEKLPLPLSARTEYYDAPTAASAGWRSSSGSYADSCTNLAAANFGFSTTASSCATAVTSCTTALSVTGTGAGPYQPPWTVSLSTPTASGSMCVTVNLDGTAAGKQCTSTGTPGSAPTSTGADWLRFPWSGASATNPTARANFGVYKSPLVYRRENY